MSDLERRVHAFLHHDSRYCSCDVCEGMRLEMMRQRIVREQRRLERDFGIETEGE